MKEQLFQQRFKQILNTYTKCAQHKYLKKYTWNKCEKKCKLFYWPCKAFLFGFHRNVRKSKNNERVTGQTTERHYCVISLCVSYYIIESVGRILKTYISQKIQTTVPTTLFQHFLFKQTKENNNFSICFFQMLYTSIE